MFDILPPFPHYNSFSFLPHIKLEEVRLQLGSSRELLHALLASQVAYLYCDHAYQLI